MVKDLVSDDIKMLCEWKNCEVIELTIQPDHVHLIVSVPPKVSISELMGTLKGKLAIKLFKSYPQLKKNRTADADLLGKSFLVKRLLCKYHWTQRGLNPQVCEILRGRR